MQAIRSFFGYKTEHIISTKEQMNTTIISKTIEENSLIISVSSTSESVNNIHSSMTTSTTKQTDTSHVVQLDDYEFPSILQRNSSTTNRSISYRSMSHRNSPVLRSDDFHSVEMISVGTNSILYKAYLHNKKVIIKMIHSNVQNDINIINEFQMESNILQHCQHTHIVKYLGNGIIPRRFIVLEYLNEGTLSTKLNNSINETSDILDVLIKGIQISDAMEYLHIKCIPNVSIIHRDLKPSNIGFLNGTIKIIDFGLSIAIKQRTLSIDAYNMTGGTGTMRYMAPEVALNQYYSEKVDVYSFSIILWQIASNKIPFEYATHESFLTDVIHGGMRPPIDPIWPEEFQNLLTQCWDANQLIRPSFTEIKSILELLVISVMSKVASPMSGKRSPRR